jgi:hypothetical protein
VHLLRKVGIERETLTADDIVTLAIAIQRWSLAIPARFNDLTTRF